MIANLFAYISSYWQQFTWLRPMYLWLLIPLVVFAWWHLRQSKTTAGWRALIAPELLQAMLQTQPQKSNKPRWFWLVCALCCTTLALAGPSFSRQQLNTLKLTDALVIGLDLSPSMLAEDIKPSRLKAAHFKILDLLQARDEGYTALIAYAGSAHVVAPLSDDANTLAALVPSLEPAIMPTLGSQAEDAVEQAITLLKNAQFSGGRIVLFTDGIVPEAATEITALMKQHPAYELDIVAVGTEQGAPVPLANGQFARDGTGQVVMNPLPWSQLQQLSAQLGGKIYHLQREPQAVEQLAKASLTQTANDKTDSNVDLPQDHGYLLLPLIALFSALAFLRPEYLLRTICLLLALLIFQPASTWAQPLLAQTPAENLTAPAPNAAPDKWRDFWQTPDQQASQALAQGDVEAAYQRFENPQWKALAAYQAQHYAEAEQLFQQDQSAAGHYNTANAQAQQGKLQEAIANYQRALEQDPSLTDAQANKDLVEALLKEQQSQQQQGGESAPDQNGQPSDDQQNQQNSQQQGQQQQSDNSQTGEQDSSQQQGGEQADAQQSDESQSQSADGSSGESSQQDSASQQQASAAEQQQQAEQDAQNMAQRAAKAAEQDASSDEKNEAGAQQQQSEAAPNAEQAREAHSAVAGEQSPPTEEQQALEQQLRRVPDDPAGLLRNKFNYYYQLDRRQRQYEGRQQEQPRW